MTHQDRAEAVLTTAVRECVKGLPAASASMIRQRVQSCLETALAMCKEDASEIHERINKEREHPRKDYSGPMGQSL